MKTLILTLNLMLGLTLHSLASGEQIKLSDEAYIDDIPFNTELVARDYITRQLVADTLRPETEEYVNDIPFDTHAILAKMHSDSATTVRYQPAAESYIDDIPFRTEMIVDHYCHGNHSGVCLRFSDSEISLKN